MAMMAMSPQRRVLGDLDGNKVLSSPGRSLLVGNDAFAIAAAKRCAALSEIRAPDLKRKSDFAVAREPDEKRLKLAGEMQMDCGEEEDESSRDFSDTSVFDAACNDSNITAMTEVEEDLAGSHMLPAQQDVAVMTAQVAPSPPSITPEEARQRAETLRLRLQLSMYKVRTNQINVPLDRLAIFPRTSPSTNASTTSKSTTRFTRPNSQDSAIRQNQITGNPSYSSGRTPLPTTTSRPQTADAALHSRVTFEGDDDENDGMMGRGAHDSSPQARREPMSSPVKMGYATPMLPRSRDVFRGMQFGTPGDEKDLTSSVVKGRAADGLLKLMAGR